MRRHRRIFIAILVVAIVGFTAAIVVIARTNEVDWRAIVAGVAAGAIVVAAGLRRERRAPDDRSVERSTGQSLGATALIVAGSFASVLPPTWQVGLLAFMDTFLIGFLFALFGPKERAALQRMGQERPDDA